MSWEPYVQALTDGGFYKGCIAGQNGQVWGSTPSFKPASIEITTLDQVLRNDKEAVKTAKQRGFTLQSVPYAVTRLEATDDVCSFLVGRCKEHGGPAHGTIIARTGQTIVIGIHDPIFAENLSFEKGNVTIFQLAESLAAMNF